MIATDRWPQQLTATSMHSLCSLLFVITNPHCIAMMQTANIKHQILTSHGRHTWMLAFNAFNIDMGHGTSAIYIAFNIICLMMDCHKRKIRVCVCARACVFSVEMTISLLVPNNDHLHVLCSSSYRLFIETYYMNETRLKEVHTKPISRKCLDVSWPSVGFFCWPKGREKHLKRRKPKKCPL